MPEAVTIDDLKSGRRARITEKETEQLTGRKCSSLQRDRWKGKGMPFQKDENGRVWYEATDVLTYIGGRKHLSTQEYDTSTKLANLTKAREEKHQKPARRM